MLELAEKVEATFQFEEKGGWRSSATYMYHYAVQRMATEKVWQDISHSEGEGLGGGCIPPPVRSAEEEKFLEQWSWDLLPGGCFLENVYS